jgi:hypothetical protein
MLEQLAQLAGVISVVVGVVISIKSFNYTRQKEADARIIESQRPFFELRQNLYLEAIQSAVILANGDTHTEEEVSQARKRFRDLYVAELSMVESKGVEKKMKALAQEVDPSLREFTPAQNAAYNLSHEMALSFTSLKFVPNVGRT